MTAVSSQPVHCQLLWNDEWQTVVLPLAIASSHRHNVAVAQLLETLCGQRRSHSPGAINNDGSFFIGDRLFDLYFQESTGEKNRAGQMPLIPLVLFPDVQQHKIIAMFD